MIEVIDEPQREAANIVRAYTMKAFARANGISVVTAYREISAGRLRSFKVGRRTLIAVTEAERWLNERAQGERCA